MAPLSQADASPDVDAEGKATSLAHICRVSRPGIAFNLSWISFHAAFLTCFASAALLPAIAADLGLSRADVGNAAVASVCGAIASRLVMGTVLDLYGPRLGIALCLGTTGIAGFGIAFVRDAAGFIIVRLLVGFDLAAFVASAGWVLNNFSPSVAGSATALAAGWGDAGGGMALLLVPLLYSAMRTVVAPSQAWRYTLCIPPVLQLIVAAMVLWLGVDTPEGNFAVLKAQGKLPPPKGLRVWRAALLNYRVWVAGGLYGTSFGAALTVNNSIAAYLATFSGVGMTRAALLGSAFGLMNVVSRPSGGALADAAARQWGMRGRLWVAFLVQLLAGGACMLLGTARGSLAATMATLLVFALLVQQAAGALFTITPFISKRSSGCVQGIVGACGNAGAALCTCVFFNSPALPLSQGLPFMAMGAAIVGCTSLYALLFFPMWGGMWRGPVLGVDEAHYYLAEYSKDEIEAGLHTPSLKFAAEAASQRGLTTFSESFSSTLATLSFSKGGAAAPAAAAKVVAPAPVGAACPGAAAKPHSGRRPVTRTPSRVSLLLRSPSGVLCASSDAGGEAGGALDAVPRNIADQQVSAQKAGVFG